MGENLIGLRPQAEDVIITGRSVNEMEYTLKWLRSRNIRNSVFFNNILFNEKTREKSGIHKAKTLNNLIDNVKLDIQFHYDDDPIQADIIERECPHVKVIRIVHDLVEKENVWHGDTET